MADSTLNKTLARPTITFTCLSTFSIVNTTLPKPTLKFIVNDWSLVQTLPKPTLNFQLTAHLNLNETISKPVLEASILSGAVFSLNKTLAKPVVEATLTTTVIYSLNKTLPKPRLNTIVYQDGILVLDTRLARPTITINVINDSVITTSKTYTMNLFNGAVTEYSNYDFNSFYKMGSKYYGVKSTGVYEMYGDTDLGTIITSEVHLPISSFDKQGLKACSDAIILGRLDGDIEFKIVMDEQEEREGLYVTDDGRQGLHRIRVKVPKGLKGAVLQPKLKNVDGSNFSINNLELFLAELQRIR